MTQTMTMTKTMTMTETMTMTKTMTKAFGEQPQNVIPETYDL